jgi:hypothetical protein
MKWFQMMTLMSMRLVEGVMGGGAVELELPEEEAVVQLVQPALPEFSA